MSQDRGQMPWIYGVTLTCLLVALGVDMVLHDPGRLPWYVLSVVIYAATALWPIPGAAALGLRWKALLMVSLLLGGILMWVGLAPRMRLLWFLGVLCLILANVVARSRSRRTAGER